MSDYNDMLMALGGMFGTGAHMQQGYYNQYQRVDCLYGWAKPHWHDWATASYPSPREERCSYCARKRVNAIDNCAGCGAPA